MSLHLGNLSSRVRIDELERVFRRFGRCNVQVKDKFGFVVYDIPANAEKALRTLRGRNICGEPITLSWSNRQPRPLQRFTRGGRNFGRENYVRRKLSSEGRRDYKTGSKKPDGDGRRLNSAELGDEATSYNNNTNSGEKDNSNAREDLPDEGGGVEPNFLDNDRWGEKVGNLSNKNEGENGLEFDRYEPHPGDDSRNEDEIPHITHSGGSPALEKSGEKKGTEQIGGSTLNNPDNIRTLQTCYICGELGHKMRNCPRENAPHRRKLSRIDYKRDNEINFRSKGELKRPGSKFRGRDAVSVRKMKIDRETPSSRRHRRLINSGHSPVKKEVQRSRKGEYVEKKRSRRETRSPERYCAKKSRGAVSSRIHSDYTASRSGSRSKSSNSASGSRLHSRLKSVSSRSLSPSSGSRPTSASYSSRSGGSKSKSRSSSPTSLSLSVSLDRPLPSSPNKLQINEKNPLVNVEMEQPVEGDAGSDNSKLENATIAVENGSAVGPLNVDEEIGNEHSERRNDDNNCEVKNSCSWLLEKTELQETDVQFKEMDHMLTPTKNLESEVSEKSRNANLTSITPEELYTVLKHYGLDQPGENQKNLPVEAYFGSARLWPWEIIYYRRLKKGPISTENYARRVAQNKEFGIVDKYIRSSSGWGELGHDNA